MRKRNRLFLGAFGLLAAAWLVLTAACGLSRGDNPYGELVGRTDCKSFPSRNASPETRSGPSGRECIEYTCDGGGVLRLKHINAGFNCCPGTVSADIRISAGEIRIKEMESSSLCDCLCLYDIDYEFTDIQPGLYRILVVGPYQPESGPPLEFLADLRGAGAGTYCVERTRYPWGY